MFVLCLALDVSPYVNTQLIEVVFWQDNITSKVMMYILNEFGLIFMTMIVFSTYI